ncbi:MAG TPA: M23 family metallopeptidase [Candidatus Eisenbacteria bacterium]|jgi:murein DD-endopeptidase MepM/ murein hydrolase activator NlpD|nr:M23 family metallopeptidase [Candidatus Eisenbacteria bacterium]
MGSGKSGRVVGAVLAATFVLVICGAGVEAGAQTRKRAPQKKATAAVWTRTDCGGDVAVFLSAPGATQGGLLQTELRSPTPLSDVSGTWDEKPIPFWQETPSATSATKAPSKAPAASKSKSAPQDIRRALLGIDLEKPAGTYDFTVSAKTADATTVSCKTPIMVRAGKFATERLRVAPNFVEPNPEQLAKAQEDGKKLRELYATVTPERLWQGRFRIPIDGATTGKNFGRRRVLNGKPSSPHTGVDIPALTGISVHASQRGRVVLAEELYFSGNTVLIDHGLGVYTLYGHFSEINVKPGDLVEPGAVIGKVGATGRVTGPHLHWGLTVDRARVNALSIVSPSVR